MVGGSYGFEFVKVFRYFKFIRGKRWGRYKKRKVF